jgi:hypothetical protein
MNPHPNTLARLRRELRQRLDHNEAYLAQKMGIRLYFAQLSYGEEKNVDWLIGEQAAIQAENEWIRALLAAPEPPARRPHVTVQPDAHDKRVVRKDGEIIGAQG